MNETLRCSNCGYETDEVNDNGMCPTCWEAWDKGRAEELSRIINYLINKEVLREAMFYRGWVALHHSEANGIDLDYNLGGK
jgi:hypothetical protein